MGKVNKVRPLARRNPLDDGARLASTVDLLVRVAVLALFVYWSFVLVRPFINIAIWSVVLTVALYPIYDWMVGHFGGRRWLAAALLTTITFAIIIGPATWLALGLVDSLRALSDRLDPAVFAFPPPRDAVRSWPVVGEPLYQLWNLASTNMREALAKVAPHLRPLGGILVQAAAQAGVGTVQFFAAIVVAGFLFSPAPALANAIRMFARRIVPSRGEEFVDLAGATIRAISRGVIGISVLQALLAGLALEILGVPGTSLITSAILVLAIMQIGPTPVILPLVIWSWFAYDTKTALLFSVYMVVVNLLDNVLKPIAMGRGIRTPVLVVLLGVIGGTISYGITGLFLGPIVLSVIWELALAWTKDLSAVDVPKGTALVQDSDRSRRPLVPKS